MKASASEAKRAHDVSAEVGTWYRPIKKPVTLRIDADVLAWFKKQGSGYQTRINQALRRMMLDEAERIQGVKSTDEPGFSRIRAQGSTPQPGYLTPIYPGYSTATSLA